MPTKTIDIYRSCLTDGISMPFDDLWYSEKEVDNLLSSDRSKLNELNKIDIQNTLDKLQKELKLRVHDKIVSDFEDYICRVQESEQQWSKTKDSYNKLIESVVNSFKSQLN